MPKLQIRDATLFVDVRGHGYPLLLMHGGPGNDHWSLAPLRRLGDQFTLVFYDHRCNGRSEGAPVTSMTWENLTADAEALRERLGFERWAVLGHSFGGHVALEYVLRYPASVSYLILADTAAEARWARKHAPEVMAERGFSAESVELCRRWFNGEVEPQQWFGALWRIGPAYYHRPSLLALARDAVSGGWRTKMRPEALMFAGQHLMRDWSVVHRLGEIATPTLVIAGASDFVFPPEAQQQLAAGIPNVTLQLVERAGHDPWSENPSPFFRTVRQFLGSPQPESHLVA